MKIDPNLFDFTLTNPPFLTIIEKKRSCCFVTALNGFSLLAQESDTQESDTASDPFPAT